MAFEGPKAAGSSSAEDTRRIETRLAPFATGVILLLIAYGVIVLAGTVHYTSFRVSRPYQLLGFAEVVLLLLLIASLRRGPTVRLRVAMLGASMLAAVYSAELVAQVWARRELTALARDQGLERDSRPMVQVLRDLQRSGSPVFPLLGTASFLSADRMRDGGLGPLLPLAGISNVRTIYCRELGEYLVYQSDRYGFNNPDEVWDRRPIQVMVLGDSFVQGACVPLGMDYPALLRDEWAGTISLGIGGDGPLIMLAKLVEYAASLEPEIVVWTYFEGNDLSNLERESEHQTLLSYLTPEFHQDLLNRQDEVDSVLISSLADVAATGRRDALKGILTLHRLRSLLPEHAGRTPLDMLLFSRLLEQAKTAVTGWGGEFYFVYLPAWERFHGATGPPGLEHRTTVLSILEREGIPLVDLVPTFLASNDPSTLYAFGHRYSAHLSADGYRLIADAVIMAIRGVQ